MAINRPQVLNVVAERAITRGFHYGTTAMVDRHTARPHHCVQKRKKQWEETMSILKLVKRGLTVVACASLLGGFWRASRRSEQNQCDPAVDRGSRLSRKGRAADVAAASVHGQQRRRHQRTAAYVRLQ